MHKKIFVNSMPKSGTFLLIRTVDLFGYRNFAKDLSILKKGLSKFGLWVPASFSYENINRNIRYEFSKLRSYQKYVLIGVTTPLKVPYSLCKSWLKKVPEGFFIAGHIPYTEDFDLVLQDLGFKHIIIMRDPRDVLISMAHYIAKPTHPLSKTLGKVSFNDRIQYLMNGGVVDNRVILNFRDAFLSVLKWKASKNCILIRFEDLIGEKGGGSKNQAIIALKKIQEYLGLSLDDRQLEEIYNNIFDISSPTFRKGKIASWKEEFPPGLLQVFNEGMKAVISELGYEI